MTLDSILAKIAEPARRTKIYLSKANAVAAASQFGLEYAFKETKTGISAIDYLLSAPRMPEIAQLGRVALAFALIHYSSKMIDASKRQRDTDKRDIVTEGIYSYSRHPHYEGDRLAAVGLMALYPSPLTMILSAGVFIATQLAAMGEEKRLEEKFGQQYLNYKESVPRFFLGHLLPKYWKGQ